MISIESLPIGSSIKIDDDMIRQICPLFPGMLQVVSPNGQLLAVSDRWLAVLGYVQEETSGRAYTDFLTDDSRQLVPLLYLPQLTAQGEIHEVECEYIQKNGAPLPVLISVMSERDEQGCIVRYWVSLTDIRERKRTETVLHAIAEATATKTGDAYFNVLVQQLVQNYGVCSAFITHCTDQNMTRVRTLALIQNNTLVENIEYDLAGTPCEGVINGSVCYFLEKLDELYPCEAGKASYLGVPFYNAQGTVLGHVAIMDDKPLGCDVNDVAILEIFAARGGAELECQIKARALHHSTDEINFLYAQLQDQNRHLEEIVAVRTREIEQRRQVAESLRDLMLILNSDRPLCEILDSIIAVATQLLETNSGAIYLLEPDQQTLTIRTTRGLPAAYTRNRSVPVERSLVGQAVLNRQPVVISNISAALEELEVELDFPRRSLLIEQYHTLLAVPLIRQVVQGNANEVYGSIVLYYPTQYEVSNEQIRLVTSFGAQAALAIENSRLREQVQQAAIVEERTRLARELHDSVTQSLYSLTLLAEGWRFMAAEGRPIEVEKALTELGGLGQQVLKEMRLLIHELRPPELEKERLLGALHKRLAAVEQRAGVDTNLIADDLIDLPPAQEEALYAIAQEALNNALKHAAATAVDLRLHVDNGQVALEIRDNGKGFDPAAVTGCGGLGLLSMRERAGRMGGTLTVQSASGAGTTITVTVHHHAAHDLAPLGKSYANDEQPQAALSLAR